MERHAYEPPVAYHWHNTPCKTCGKTARHAVHRTWEAPAVEPAWVEPAAPPAAHAWED